MREEVKELTLALYECFKDIADTDEYTKMHDDNYVKKSLKNQFGKEKLQLLDSYPEEVWYDAWGEFDQMIRMSKNT